MLDHLMEVINPLGRWFHMVGATLLLGGTLFHTIVVPRALENVKEEQALAILGQMRWVFRKVVWIGAISLVLSGLLSLRRLWPSYVQLEPQRLPWAPMHVVVGVLSLLIALRVTVFGRIPDRWLSWMRVNVVVLLVGILFANMARHTRLDLQESQYQQLQQLAKESQNAHYYNIVARNVQHPNE